MILIKLSCAIITMALGSVSAQNLTSSETSTFYKDRSHQPKVIKPFELTYYDIRESIYNKSKAHGKISTEFEIDEKGNVINPIIVDTFDISLNDVILDKVRRTKYHPATQNGIAVKVKYKLPIKFQ